MSIVDRLRSLLQPPAEPAASHFIYILLPEDLDPLDRCAHYADALDAELKLAGSGWVSGGGSMLGPEQPDGTSEVEFSGIDIEVAKTGPARELLQLHLAALGCPAGTEIHYTEGSLRLQDEYDGQGWRLARPRGRLHPGFGL